MKIVKTEIEGIVRDLETNALINTDSDALKAYKYKKQKQLELNQVIQEHKELRKELADMKELLMQLVGKSR
jgi:hypothetical protein